MTGTRSRDRPLELWALRLAWLAMPLLAGPGLRAALDTLAATPALIIEIALWATWFAGLVAGLVPHPVSLVVVRMLAPASAGFSIIAALTAGWDASATIAVGAGLTVTALSLMPSIGDRMINGSAYGSERRMALRTPAVAYIGPIPVAWTVGFAGLVGWAVAAGAEIYWLAGLLAVVGAAMAWAGGRLLHQLARRWIVFVPAGFVIHDPFQLLEPVLVARSKITRLGPAELSTEGGATELTTNVGATDGRSTEGGATDGALDLSAGSLGLALQVESSEPLLFSVRRGRDVEGTQAAEVVFSPTLPGAVLSEARIRGIKIRRSSR